MCINKILYNIYIFHFARCIAYRRHTCGVLYDDCTIPIIYLSQIGYRFSFIAQYKNRAYQVFSENFCKWYLIKILWIWAYYARNYINFISFSFLSDKFTRTTYLSLLISNNCCLRCANSMFSTYFRIFHLW